ncbi:MAG: ATP-dependent RNA helicase DbpA [Pseudohongiellaceae bacterium]
MSGTAFTALDLHSALLKNLEVLGYLSMTPIQSRSLPPMLDGRDLIGQAKTGSGKTAAFGLALLQKLDVRRFHIQSLVLCPTRELADQVAAEIRRLGQQMPNMKVLTLCGGAPIGPQIGSLEHGAHIIVGTPGRVEDHLRRGTLSLPGVSTLVLDEADRMLEMGFQESLEAIFAQLPSQRQTLMFSATFGREVKATAERIMQDPVFVEVGEAHDKSSIDEHFYRVADDGERLTVLRLLLQQVRPASALVFCATRRDVDEVAAGLRRHDFSALPLHGDMDQKDRDRTLVRFANNSVSVLVASDVAARGLDIGGLDLVVNYHVARDPDTHLHRVGRTGRAGASGMACTLFEGREEQRVRRLAPDFVDEAWPPMALLEAKTPWPEMVTLQVDGGKRQKLRPGDIVGALTGDGGIPGERIGKILVTDVRAYVAVGHDVARAALKQLGEGRMKGRSFRVRQL